MTTWYVPRESKEWVGPLTPVAIVNGQPATIDPANVHIALLPRGTRPTDADWVAPDVEPGGTALGIMLDVVDAPRDDGIWAQLTDQPEVPVIPPWHIGYVRRT